MKRGLFILLIFSITNQLFAQNLAGITGKIIDKKDQSELIGVTVLIQGTSFGTATNANGQFLIKGVKPGEYNLEVSYIGYKKVIQTGIRLKANETKASNIS